MRFEGTEDEFEAEPPDDGPPCFRVTRSSFVLRGAGTYRGVDDAGREVVFEPAVPEGEPVHTAGPVRLRIEATATYYFGPEGTYLRRLEDGRGDPDTFGEQGPIPATFELHADGLAGPDGGPCVGSGHFWRGTDTDRTVFHAEWTWDHDCAVHGDVDGASGTAVAPAGTKHAFHGTYEACFDPPCPDNVRGELVQQFAGETPGSP